MSLERDGKMQIVKYVLIALYMINCLALIILVMKQNRDDKGASRTIVGSSSTDNFYEKNKSRTREGKLKKWTIIFGIIFLLFTIALSVINMM